MSDDSGDNGKWSVRGVPRAYRERAAELAQRRDMTLGEVVCAALDRELAAEREPLGVAILAPLSDVAADVEQELRIAERAIGAAIALAGAADVPAGFRRKANRLLRDALPAAGTRRNRAALRLDAPTPHANGAVAGGSDVLSDEPV